MFGHCVTPKSFHKLSKLWSSPLADLKSYDQRLAAGVCYLLLASSWCLLVRMLLEVSTIDRGPETQRSHRPQSRDTGQTLKRWVQQLKCEMLLSNLNWLIVNIYSLLSKKISALILWNMLYEDDNEREICNIYRSLVMVGTSCFLSEYVISSVALTLS